MDVSLADSNMLSEKSSDSCSTARELLRRLDELIRNFRGGDHEYVSKFAMALGAMPDYYAAAG